MNEHPCDAGKTERMEAALRDCILIRKRGISFVELMQAAGPDAVGDLGMSSEKGSALNIYYWFNVSPEFFAAFGRLRKIIDIVPTSAFVYLADGRMPTAPIAKRARKYEEPHWAPVVVNMKPDKARPPGRRYEPRRGHRDTEARPDADQA